MSKIYRCPNNCYVADYQRRCPECDKFLLYDGEGTREDAESKTRDLQLSGDATTKRKASWGNKFQKNFNKYL